jgi:hypothetical protein
MSEADQREHYANCGKSLEWFDRIRWAEGILELFGDREWAKREYAAMSATFTAPIDRAVYEASQKLHFGQTF